MNLKPTVIALSLIAALSSASALTMQDIGPATVSYDETTTLGFLSSWFSSGTTYGFSWSIPNSAQVVSFGSNESLLVDLPSFTIDRNPGWNLSGDFVAFLGNPSFTEIGGATTNILGTVDISVDGGAASTTSGLVGFVITSSAPGYLGGYFSQTVTVPVGGFTSLAQSNASLTLMADGGTFSNVLSNPQNKLEYSFTATPVPEPETYVMLLSGIAALGWLARRRRNA